MKIVFKKIELFFYTVRYLRIKQLFYQLYYRLVKVFFKNKERDFDIKPLVLLYPQYPYGNVRKRGDDFYFSFLNLEKQFKGEIDWGYCKYGKLWAFNLNYFDFLSDDRLSDDDMQQLIIRYLPDFAINSIGMASYTTSLRGYNWIKYINQSNWQEKDVLNHLYSQYALLYNNFEYHILANHLLENVLSMLFAAFFFSEKKFYNKAKKELEQQLKEQICDDGCHYERSVMYHCILLGRMIEATYLLKNNSVFHDDSFISFVEHKTALMLGFLEQTVFDSGDIPMFNDAIRGAFVSPYYLFRMAQNASIDSYKVSLSDSGYRKINRGNYELVVDTGGVEPSYQPGHTHADSFSFELYYSKQPIIVDVGTSTYENNAVRQFERSTRAHNTVVYNDESQSQVWSAFRVGKRVKIKEVVESEEELDLSLVGFDSKVNHQRTFSCEDNRIVINDRIKCNKGLVAMAYFHFHPDVSVEKITDNSYKIGAVMIHFSGIEDVEIEIYQYAKAMNVRVEAKCLVVVFSEKMTTKIAL